jgi:hypothetical protein
MKDMEEECEEAKRYIHFGLGGTDQHQLSQRTYIKQYEWDMQISVIIRQSNFIIH